MLTYSQDTYIFITAIAGAILGGIYFEFDQRRSNNALDIVLDTTMGSIAGAATLPFAPILLPGIIAKYRNRL